MFRAILVLLVLFGLDAGSLAQDPNDKMDKILITLERTRCFGRILPPRRGLYRGVAQGISHPWIFPWAPPWRALKQNEVILY
jgi:hypothetical protein